MLSLRARIAVGFAIVAVGVAGALAALAYQRTRAVLVRDRQDAAVVQTFVNARLVRDALRDPDLSTKTTLRYSPNPNVLQKEHFAERYIRFGRPGDALAWLDGDWGYREEGRERLLAEAYAGLGDTGGVRVGLSPYSTEEEVDRLIDALDAISQ